MSKLEKCLILIISPRFARNVKITFAVKPQIKTKSLKKG